VLAKVLAVLWALVLASAMACLSAMVLVWALDSGRAQAWELELAQLLVPVWGEALAVGLVQARVQPLAPLWVGAWEHRLPMWARASVLVTADAWALVLDLVLALGSVSL